MANLLLPNSMKRGYDNKILSAADELFRNRGIVSVTMEDIAHKMGTSKKTIYQTYKSKDEIIATLAKKFFQEQKEKYADMKNASSAIEELLLLLKHYQDLFETLQPRLIHEIQKYYPDIWTMILKHKNDNLLERVKQNLVRGIKEKLYRDDIDVDFIAKLRATEIELAFNNYIFPNSHFPITKKAEQLLKLYFFGIVTSETHKYYVRKFQSQ